MLRRPRGRQRARSRSISRKPDPELVDKLMAAGMATAAMAKESKGFAATVASYLAWVSFQRWMDKQAGEFTESVVDNFPPTPEQPPLPEAKPNPPRKLYSDDQNFYPVFLLGDVAKFLAMPLQRSLDATYGAGRLRVFSTEASVESTGDTLQVQQHDLREILERRYDGQEPILTFIAPGLNEITRSDTATAIHATRILRHRLRGTLARAAASRDTTLFLGMNSEVNVVLRPPEFKPDSVISATQDDHIYTPALRTFRNNAHYVRGTIADVVRGHNGKRRSGLWRGVITIDPDGSFDKPARAVFDDGTVAYLSDPRPKLPHTGRESKFRDVVSFSHTESLSLPHADASGWAEYIVRITEPEVRTAIAEREREREREREQLLAARRKEQMAALRTASKKGATPRRPTPRVARGARIAAQG